MPSRAGVERLHRRLPVTLPEGRDDITSAVSVVQKCQGQQLAELWSGGEFPLDVRVSYPGLDPPCPDRLVARALERAAAEAGHHDGARILG